MKLQELNSPKWIVIYSTGNNPRAPVLNAVVVSAESKDAAALHTTKHLSKNVIDVVSFLPAKMTKVRVKMKDADEQGLPGYFDGMVFLANKEEAEIIPVILVPYYEKIHNVKLDVARA
jgi:hypothetical protein